MRAHDRRSSPLLATALLVLGCPGPDPIDPTLVFDQAPGMAIEAGESVNLSVTAAGDAGGDPTLLWSATCGQVMGLTRRGSFLAPDAADACEVTATRADDSGLEAVLSVEVTPPAGGGAVRWTRHVASDFDDAVRRLAPTPDGGLVALVETDGDLAGAAQGDLDVVVLRLDPEGETVWARALATETREFAGDVAVATDGSVAVVGSTYGALGGASAGEQDAFVAWLGADGAVEAVVQYGTDRTDTAQAVAVAANGDLLVAGWTEGALGGASLGGPDAYVRRFDADGQVLWTRQLGGAGIDFAIGLALDGEDAVLVGTTDGLVGAAAGGGLDGYLARLSGAGDLVAVRQWGGATDDRSYAVAARPGGGVVVAASEGDDAVFTAWDGADAVRWRHVVGTAGEDIGQAVAVDPSGDVFAVGFSTGDVDTPNVGFFDAYVRRLDPDGEPLWTRRLGSAADDYAFAVALLADGDVAIGGRTDGLLAADFGWGGDGFVRRLGP